LPLIEREDLQRDPRRFLSEATGPEGCLDFRTSGTSGRPIAVSHDQFYLFQVAAHRERRTAVLAGLVGKRLGFRHATIRPAGGAGDRASRTFASRSLIPATIRGPRLRISQATAIERNVELLNEFRPDVISSFGSYIEELFLHLHRERPPFHRPRVVNFSSEGLSDGARRLITEEFGIEVIGFYGSVEAFTLGFECEAHRGYHLNEDLYPVRIVDRQGRTLPDGHAGEVVISNLVTRGTLLLNYRLGDVGAKLPDPCPCGRSLPLLSYLQGRIGDWVETPSGQTTHPNLIMQLLNAEAGTVLRFQVVQDSPERFTVSVVAGDGTDRAALGERLRRGFAERLGPTTSVEVRFVDDLPRSPSGKVPAVVSRSGARRDPPGG
jgi:phenylacetate-CoA ligase